MKRFKKRDKNNSEEKILNFDPYEREEQKGNILTFFCGIIVFCIGIYMIFQNTIITTGFSLQNIFGFTPNFGVVLIPLLLGIIRLFFDEESVLGWILVIIGILIIIVGILMGLRIHFRAVTLFEGIIMFGMVAAGIGTILKGIFGKNK